MQPIYQNHPLRKHFAGLVEQAFCVEVGLCDPKLNDYLIALLLEFVHVDRMNKVRNSEGRRLNNLVELLGYVAAASESDASEPGMHRYIGDVILFWTGLFPEGIRRSRLGPNPDRLAGFVDRGKQAYAIVSERFDEDDDPPASLFRRLSEEFEVCMHGLGLVRKSWQDRRFGGPDDNPHLIY